VKFPDGMLEPCLAPCISLFNHSPWPHSVHFSKVNPNDNMLSVTAFRGAEPGEQLFISYGALPSHHTLLFYGF
ncbi:uncharacterized protein HaLaN_25877, partial [Haematococcus lacustris]